MFDFIDLFLSLLSGHNSSSGAIYKEGENNYIANGITMMTPEQVEKFKQDIEKDEIVLTTKEATFDIRKIKPYVSKEKKQKVTFRPQTFKQFIGQENNKKNIMLNIERIRRGIKTHFFFDALQGHGKTTMAYLIAQELNAKIIERVGQQINDDDFINIVNEINNSSEEYVVLFIDEIDTLKPKYCKTLNTMLEDYNIAGIAIKPFIFIGATINKHILIKKSSDTMDRISAQIRFSRYNEQEIITILKQYKQSMYEEYQITEEAYNAISTNCKFSPRIAIEMMKDYLILQNIEELLKYKNIVKDGLDITDIKILSILKANVKPIGVDALAQKVGINKRDYEVIYEPYLVEMDFINRVPRRTITEKGNKILEEIKWKK